MIAVLMAKPQTTISRVHFICVLGIARKVIELYFTPQTICQIQQGRAVKYEQLSILSAPPSQSLRSCSGHASHRPNNFVALYMHF